MRELFELFAMETPWALQRTPFQRLFQMNSLMDILPEEGGITWFVGRDQRIYRYEETGFENDSASFRVLIRSMTLAHSGGSVGLRQDTDKRAVWD